MADNIIYAREADWVSLLDKIREKSGKKEGMTIGQAITAMNDVPEMFYKNMFIGKYDDMTEFNSETETLGGGVFAVIRSLTNVNLPNYTGFTADGRVSSFTFANCDYIESFNAPKMKKIGTYAFLGTDKMLSMSDMPNLTGVSNFAFSNSGIKYFKFYNNVYLYYYAFENSGLTTLKTLGNLSFSSPTNFESCKNLQFVWVGPNGNINAPLLTDGGKNTKLKDIYTERTEGITNNGSVTIHYGVTESQFDAIVRSAGGPLE